MRSLIVIIAVLALVAIFAISCKKKEPPLVDGKTVLTVAQYNQLIGRMKDDLANSAGNEQAVKSDLFSEGSRYYREERFGDAATAFDNLIKENPENARAWFMLGSCREKMGDLTQAQQAYKRSYDIMVKQGYIAESRSLM